MRSCQAPLHVGIAIEKSLYPLNNMKPFFCLSISCMLFISSYAQVKTAKVNHYLFPEFNQGIILLKTGKKEAKLLNYNALTEEIIFDNRGTKLAIAKKDLGRIDSVFIRDRKFIILDNKFVELIHHSDWDLYVEYKCNLKEQGKDVGLGGVSQTSAISTPAGVYLGGVAYNLTLPDDFETEPYFLYWLKKNGKSKQFTNIKQLKKSYKDKKKLYDDYMSKHDVEYENTESIIQLLEHLEAN